MLLFLYSAQQQQQIVHIHDHIVFEFQARECFVINVPQSVVLDF